MGNKLPTNPGPAHAKAKGGISETASLNPAPTHYTKTGPQSGQRAQGWEPPSMSGPSSDNRWPGDNPPRGATGN